MALFDIFKKKENAAAVADVLPILPEEIYKTGVLDLQDVIAPHALRVTSRELDLGEKIARTFFVISYPRFLTTGWFAPIINMDKVIDISIFIHPMDTNEMLRKFQKKVAEVQSQISSREEKGMVRDPMLDTAYTDLEQLRNSLQQAQERIFEVGLYLTIYGATREAIDKVETEVRSVLESRLVYIRPALFQQEQGFRSVLPLAIDEIAVHTKLNSAPLSSIFPFISFDLTSDRGILYGINRHNSSLILFDRFSLENYNSVTFAKSGAGKSYTTKLEILRSLMFDTEVIVIDPEREYEYLSQAVGGRYFNISLSSEHHINPFDLPIPREDENPADVLRNNTITLVGLFRIMLGGLTPEEDAVIEGHHGGREFRLDRAAAPVRFRARALRHGGERVARAAPLEIHERYVGRVHESSDKRRHEQKNGGLFRARHGRRLEAGRYVHHHAPHLEYCPQGAPQTPARHR
ncbi:MAG: Type IV secretory pathway VirB4 protein-like protein [Candidatus Kaiserbacteria bacterium GW2011_GWC2_52_8b]|uniref:Type IV secretory pathway VirB4 protein-like protein n=1 Tax=Candidatus Kaiserbacteria bacterium GW2011_GWC2_52_8b TaxID=1618676 RepID=A0A0G1XIY2_9BACT|nr:MAG: Type IV secretory pathway VirB4 protein-like protein [Candidatus Kaiserbacteria bacterium GW2011_GWC2_52_8b]